MWNLALSKGNSANTAAAAENVAQDIWDVMESLFRMEKYNPKNTVAENGEKIVSWGLICHIQYRLTHRKELLTYYT